MSPLAWLKALSVPQEVWTGLLAAATAVVGVLYVGKSCAYEDLYAERVEETRRADSLAAEASAERARADGWEVAFGQNVEGLQEALQERDSTIARLARDYQASRIRISQLAALTIEAGGSGESDADTAITNTGDTVPSEWRGTYDDGILTADWTFNRGPPRSFLFVRDWEARLGIELVTATTGDDRVLVTARTSHPDRVRARIDSLFVDPPPPEVRERGMAWWWAVVLVSGGALAQEAGAFSALLGLF